MDYELYDKLQAQLGGLGGAFKLQCTSILNASDADTATKDLVAAICAAMMDSLDEVGRSISSALIAVDTK